MPSSSINTGLAAIPDLTDIQSAGKLGFQFIQLYNAVGVLQQAIDSYTGNSPVQASTSSQSPETTILVGNTSSMWAKCGTTAISAGYLVYFTNNSGVTTVNLAKSDAAYSIAIGISITSAAAGANIQVLLLGLFNFGGSVTPGSLYYTSPTVPGGLTVTIPTTGNLIQPVGYGVDTNSIFFNPCLNPQLAT